MMSDSEVQVVCALVNELIQVETWVVMNMGEVLRRARKGDAWCVEMLRLAHARNLDVLNAEINLNYIKVAAIARSHIEPCRAN